MPIRACFCAAPGHGLGVRGIIVAITAASVVPSDRYGPAGVCDRSVFLPATPRSAVPRRWEQISILCHSPCVAPFGESIIRSMPLAAGTRFGSYEILGLIGAGGMGEVYRAHDSKLKRAVAIKILPEALADEPE